VDTASFSEMRINEQLLIDDLVQIQMNQVINRKTFGCQPEAFIWISRVHTYMKSKVVFMRVWLAVLGRDIRV